MFRLIDSFDIKPGVNEEAVVEWLASEACEGEWAVAEDGRQKTELVMFAAAM